MKHPMSDELRHPTQAWADYDMGKVADELDRQRRDIAILCECIEATRNPSTNRIYAECDVAEVLERNRR